MHSAMHVAVVEWLSFTSSAIVWTTDIAYDTDVEPEISSGHHSAGRINVTQFRSGCNHQLFLLGAYRRVLFKKEKVNRSSIGK